MEFHALAAAIRLSAGRGELCDQLDRAALSIVLNTAEAGGRTGAADNAAACVPPSPRSARACRPDAQPALPAAEGVISRRLVPERVDLVTPRVSAQHFRICDGPFQPMWGVAIYRLEISLEFPVVRLGPRPLKLFRTNRAIP